MTYKALLVDDEMPALRYLQTIIEKYLPAFSIESMLTNGKDALDYLRDHRIDLMITDIRMPLIDGLELAREAKLLNPDLRVIIVSGYSDFDYAKEAIEVSVDSYILKPISIHQVIEAIGSAHQKLVERRAEQEKALLPMLASGYTLDNESINRLFANMRFLFILLRRGNLPIPPIAEPKNITMAAPDQQWYAVLQGRDENEQIVIATANDADTAFTQKLEHYFNVYIDDYKTGTAIYDPQPHSISSLPSFIRKASNAILHTVVVGKKILSSVLSASSKERKHFRLDTTNLKYLDYLISGSKQKRIREFLVQLSEQWDQNAVAQIEVSRAINQILDCAFERNPVLYDKQEEIIAEINELYLYTQSYAELVSNVYAVLFDENYTSQRISSTEDLYECTVSFILENYAKPITIQTLSTAIGISQTYISRLFRQHGNTTFNTFLTKCRIENAIRLMKSHPDTLLRDVAESVGYDDASYFSRVFRKMTGLTPSQYTEALGQDIEYTVPFHNSDSD